MRYLILAFFLILILNPVLVHGQVAPSILFWHHDADPTRAEFWQSLADEFNATNPDAVTVQVQYFPAYYNQHDAILSGLLNGTLPDVAMVRNMDAALYQLSDALADLSMIDGDDFYPEMWAQDTTNGQQLGVPLGRAATALYINMDALRELGYNAPPTTRAELGEMACTFALRGSVGFDIPLDASYTFALGYPLNIDTLDFTDARLLEVVVFYHDMLSRRCARLTVNEAFSPQNRFASGQTLFYFDSTAAKPYVMAAIGNYYAEPFELVMTPIPSNEGWIANLTGASLSVFHSDPQREGAAIAWVEWLSQAEQVERWAAVNEALPARQDATNPLLTDFADAIWLTEPHFAGYDLIRDELVFAMRDIWNGQDANERLAALTDTSQQIQEAFAGRAN